VSDRRTHERRKRNVPVAADRRSAPRRQHERRDSTRAPLDLWVEEERGDELYFRRTGNVSLGGLYFEQTIPHALGTRVKVRFALPGDPDVIEAHGEVVNTPKSKDGLGMGIMFIEMKTDARARLQHFVDETDDA
jgi:uncharacterized protein (TIGR02266 family)